jgi:uncharacterized protein (DUF4415 family)
MSEKREKEKQPRGRPVGWRKRQRSPEEGPEVFTTIRISVDFRNFLESERQQGERYDDTIGRLLREKTNTIAGLRQEIDRLMAYLQQLQPHGGVLA